MPFATPLLHAVANGHEDMVRFLLDKNAGVDQRAPCASPNCRGQPTALEVAVQDLTMMSYDAYGKIVGLSPVWGPRAPALGAREAVSWIERSPGVVKLLLERQADPGLLKAYHLRHIVKIAIYRLFPGLHGSSHGMRAFSARKKSSTSSTRNNNSSTYCQNCCSS